MYAKYGEKYSKDMKEDKWKDEDYQRIRIEVIDELKKR